MQLSALWAQFLTTYGTLLAGLVALILVDLLLGVASALKRKVFDWKKLGDFYESNVLPLLLGWVALSLGAFAVATVPSIPPGIAALIGPGVADIAYAAVIATLGASILQNLSELQLTAPASAAPKPPAA